MKNGQKDLLVNWERNTFGKGKGGGERGRDHLYEP